MKHPARYIDYSRWLNVPPVCPGTRTTIPGLLTTPLRVFAQDVHWAHFYVRRGGQFLGRGHHLGEGLGLDEGHQLTSNHGGSLDA